MGHAAGAIDSYCEPFFAGRQSEAGINKASIDPFYPVFSTARQPAVADHPFLLYGVL